MRLSSWMSRSAVAGLVLGLIVTGWLTTTGEPPSQTQKIKGQLKASKCEAMSSAMKEREAGHYKCLCTSCNNKFDSDSIPDECPRCKSANVTCRWHEGDKK